MLETSETSTLGGALTSTAASLRVGDDAGNRQYRSLLHFNTSSLPDGAQIVTAKVQVKQQCMQGASPFAALGSLQADIRKTYFGAAAALEAGDFQSNASVSKAGLFGTTSVSGWYTAALSAFAFIDRLGTTQIRLRFVKDDNNDNLANYFCFYSGNSTTTSNRPVLTVSYYLP